MTYWKKKRNHIWPQTKTYICAENVRTTVRLQVPEDSCLSLCYQITHLFAGGRSLSQLLPSRSWILQMQREPTHSHSCESNVGGTKTSSRFRAANITSRKTVQHRNVELKRWQGLSKNKEGVWQKQKVNSKIFECHFTKERFWKCDWKI